MKQQWVPKESLAKEMADPQEQEHEHEHEHDFAPPGLLVKPKPEEHAPQPSAASASAPADPNFAQLVEEALVAWLRTKPNQSEHLSKVGLFLRGKRLLPDGKLKQFVESECPRLTVLCPAGPTSGSQYVKLVDGNGDRSGPPAAALTPQKASRPTTASTTADPDDLDEDALEALLVQHLRRQPAGSTHSPQLGEFCIKQLGLSVKGKVGRFLSSRPKIFRVSNDPKQTVTLVDGTTGRDCGSGDGGSGSGAGTSNGPKPQAAKPEGHLAAAPPGGDMLPGRPSNPAAAPDVSDVATSVLPGAAAAARETRSMHKWDPLTQEIFNFVRSRGVATFTQIDTHLRNNYKHLISSMGIPPHVWQSQVFLRKRRNIFRLQGPVVSLASHVPGEEGAAAKPTGGPSGSDSYPPPHRASISGGGAAAGGGSSSETAAAAALPGHNPVLDAFMAERRALEELRDDVTNKLASFKALSELQKENAGLRAACVTLGRELLGLKQEFTEFRGQVAAALAAGGIAGIAGMPAPMALPSDAAPGAAPAVPAGAADMASAGSGGSAADAPPPLANGTAGAAGAAQVADLPPHLQQAAAQQAAAQQAQQAVPALAGASQGGGGILLVGGHDGVSWLDSADFFSPYSGMWSALPILDQPRSFAAVVATPSDIWVAGGGNGMDWYSTVVRYDRYQGPTAGTWAGVSPMNVARGSLAAAVACGRLYCFGGGKPKEQYSVVEWYDAAQDRWFVGPEMLSRRFALGGAAIDNALYAVGGYNGESYLTTVERFDPREGRWAVLPGEMASKRGGHACVAAQGLLYALGGFDSTQAIPHCEVFDPRTNTWRQLADMSDSRAYGSAAAVGADVYAVGGLQSDMQTHAILVERYDPNANAWLHVELPTNANPRRSFLAACGLD